MQSPHRNRVANLVPVEPPAVQRTPTRSASRRRPSRASAPASSRNAPKRSSDNQPSGQPPYVYAAGFINLPESAAWLSRAEEFQRHLNLALDALKDGKPLAYPMVHAAGLAALVAMYVKSVEVDVVPTDEDIPRAQQSPVQKEEWRKLIALWELIRPVKANLRDVARVTAILTGQVTAERAERKGLSMLLQEYRRRTLAWLRNCREQQDLLRQSRGLR